MTWGLAGAFAAAFAYGCATILQALGAREGGGLSELDSRLVIRLVHSSRYLLGVSLDGLGFALSFIALRSEPLFVVQAIIATSLAVTAVLSFTILGTRPAALEWLALGGVVAGLSLLGLSANTEHPAQLAQSSKLLLLGAVIVVGVASYVTARRRQPVAGDAWAFGLLAGLMYAAGGIAARVITSSHRPLTILADPALWTLASSGILGLLLNAMALQRGSVTIATAAATAADTLVPAAIGVFVLGDRPAPGHTPIAIAGFILAVAGALSLARFGEAPSREGAGTPADDFPADVATTGQC